LADTLPIDQMTAFNRIHGQFEISTDAGRIDVEAVHAYLRRSYWAEDVPRATVEKAIAGSLCFSLFHGGVQIGLARVVTDRATFAYLCDVYVLEDYRGRGLGKWLIQELQTHPDLQGLRRFMLVTRDAHSLYEQCSFKPLADPAKVMEIVYPDAYKPARSS
jgi:GNAT superfamily N-acetyltransferase